MKTLFTSIAMLLLAGNSMAITIHVPADQADIAAGLAAASAGDTVLVACGTYDEWDLEMSSGVVLLGATGDPDCVTIDAGGNSRVILFDGTLAGTAVEGITFTGGNFSAGPGMYFWHAVAEVRNCVVVDNTGASFGGGVYVRYEDSDVSFDGCLFTGNSSSIDGGAIYAMNVNSLSFNNCTFSGNSAVGDGGAFMLYYSICDITACTIDANSAGQYGGGLTASQSTANFQRCIISNSTDGEAVFRYASGVINLACTDLYGNEGGDWTVHVVDQADINDNIYADPLYCGIDGSGNYWLRNDSPCGPTRPGCGEGMGAWGVGCEGTSTAESSWGRVKSLY